ncbi:MAG: hypothetical protein ABR524_06895 [Thermoanaerobaculia bacterium]
MTTAGWIFLVVSLTSVWSLAIWCYSRVLRGGDIEPPPDSLGG